LIADSNSVVSLFPSGLLLFGIARGAPPQKVIPAGNRKKV
jgi:hypothetical protein